MQMKKSNAAKLDEQFAKPLDASATKPDKDASLVTGMSFPTYKEYERVPGKGTKD